MLDLQTPYCHGHPFFGHLLWESDSWWLIIWCESPQRKNIISWLHSGSMDILIVCGAVLTQWFSAGRRWWKLRGSFTHQCVGTSPNWGGVCWFGLKVCVLFSLGKQNVIRQVTGRIFSIFAVFLTLLKLNRASASWRPHQASFCLTKAPTGATNATGDRHLNFIQTWGLLWCFSSIFSCVCDITYIHISSFYSTQKNMVILICFSVWHFQPFVQGCQRCHLSFRFGRVSPGRRGEGIFQFFVSKLSNNINVIFRISI